MDIDSIKVTRESTLKEALSALNQHATGILLLTDANGFFERTITDGDLRRLILSGVDLNATLSTLPKGTPVVFEAGGSTRAALKMMKDKSIHHLPVVDSNGCVVDVLDRKKIDDEILLSTPHLGEAEQYFVEEAFRSNWIAPLGPNVDAFEEELSEHVGGGYAAALSSGTAAIHLALKLLDVGCGDVVFCSSLTFAASANPIVYQGATPVFIDSDCESWNMSPYALEKAFDDAKSEGKLPKAVIVVNLYGQSADMDLLLEISNRYNVPIIEDAAESLGAKYKGKSSGTLGKIGIYSFNGNKIITTSGGGMMISDHEPFIEKAKFLATQARDPALHYQHSEIGYNYRMSNILAGVGRGQLKVLEDRVAARRKVFEQYSTLLADIDEISWMPEPEWSYSNRWLTACLVKPNSRVTSLELIKGLSDELIEGRPIWKPMHLQPVFSGCKYFTHSEVSVSDELFLSGLCLPSGSNMTETQIVRVAETVRKIMG